MLVLVLKEGLLFFGFVWFIFYQFGFYKTKTNQFGFIKCDSHRLETNEFPLEFTFRLHRSNSLFDFFPN